MTPAADAGAPAAVRPVGEEDGDPRSVEEAVALAQTASLAWGALPINERLGHLCRFRDVLLDHLGEVVDVVGRETSKPRFDIINEVIHCCGVIGYYARHGPRILKPRSVWPRLLVHKRAEVHCRPLGVVAIITPWNFPVVLVLTPVVQALVAGNAVVVKPSERTTATAQLLRRLFVAAGGPPDIFQVIPGGPKTALELARSDVNKVTFIGGREGGRAVYQAAAEKLTPVLLELGGNDAMLVARDADLERAARGAVWGAFFNAGQSCVSIERCYVEAAVAEPFIERVVALTRELSQGLPVHGADVSDHDLGPLCSVEQFDRIGALVREAVAQGAIARTGESLLAADELQASALRENRCFPPTVLTNVTHSMRLMREEIFGPVLPIVTVSDLNEAVNLANDSPYGLSASVWTCDLRAARRLASRLHVGGVVINDCLLHFGIAELPFGGVKQSGFGRSQGPHGLLEYCSTQTITRHWLGPSKEFQWFPVGTKYRWMERFARLLFRSGLSRFRRP